MTTNEKAKFGKPLRILLVMLPLSLFAMVWSQFDFQHRVVAVMQPSAAVSLGLLSESGSFGPTRVWIAKTGDGAFEYRSSLPVIGLVPFNVFDSGKTEIDLVAECQKLGESFCQFIE